jgi:sugar phosphate isomerase/epimerase
VRTRAQDAGVKFAFENHAGDTRSEEILDLIEAVGADVCGVMLDPGNAVWAMEDPIEHLLTLAPHVLCTSIRDYMLWESEEGATFQWTAIGEGMMNAATYVRLFREKCPGVPFFVETISNSQRPIPFLSSDFWDGYPNLPATELASFIALCRRGHAIEIATPPAGADARKFERQQQRAEFEKSIAYLRSLP